jgi:hypothetical protein
MYQLLFSVKLAGANSVLGDYQGDQIGRFFRLLVDCLLWTFFKLPKDPKFLGYFLHGKSYVLILTNSGLGYILGYFIANSSGHPVDYRQFFSRRK